MVRELVVLGEMGLLLLLFEMRLLLLYSMRVKMVKEEMVVLVEMGKVQVGMVEELLLGRDYKDLLLNFYRTIPDPLSELHTLFLLHTKDGHTFQYQ